MQSWGLPGHGLGFLVVKLQDLHRLWSVPIFKNVDKKQNNNNNNKKDALVPVCHGSVAWVSSLLFQAALKLMWFCPLLFRKDQNLLSPVNCWYLLLNQVRRESKDHTTLSDIYLNNVIMRFMQISEDSTRMFKKVESINPAMVCLRVATLEGCLRKV